MKLISLKLHNFKGIRDFEIKPNGNGMDIKGDNATGKTTIMDGLTWLLFNKDSQNRTSFAIKTIGDDGQTIHKLEHEVEAVFQTVTTKANMGFESQKEIKLRKVYKEHYTKKKGTATAVWDGHDTDYYVDDVPLKAKDYQNYINNLIDEDLFKLLTNPKYFNEHLHWEKRRAILLDIAGDVSDKDVIASDDRLENFDWLNGHSMDDYKKIAQGKRSTINKEIKEIPARIDELSRTVTELGNVDEIQAGIDKKTKERDDKQTTLNELTSGGVLARKRAELQELENNIRRASSDIDQQVTDLNNQALKWQGGINAGESLIKDNDFRIENLEKRKAELTKEWHKAKATTITVDSTTTCPACGQDIPKEQVEATIKKATIEFNEKQANLVNVIEREGIEIKERIEKLRVENSETQKVVESARAEIQTVKSDMQSLQSTPAPDNEQVQHEIDTLKNEIGMIEDEGAERGTEIQETIDSLNTDITSLMSERAAIDQAVNTQERITTLREREKTLASEYEEIEKQLYHIELFEKVKVELLEDKINSQFKLAKFKMFKEYDSGGVEPWCETIVNGVPYNGGLNNGMQIAVGLDIINRLEEYFGYTAPIFIDNAEAITDIPETTAQQIRMYVSAEDKKLRVE
jgi:DNA repair exonuclease SbcCD ATPase subunit